MVPRSPLVSPPDSHPVVKPLPTGKEKEGEKKKITSYKARVASRRPPAVKKMSFLFGKADNSASSSRNKNGVMAATQDSQIRTPEEAGMHRFTHPTL